MMIDRLEAFEKYREKMNDRIASIDHLGIKRFFNLDTRDRKSTRLNSSHYS